MAADTSHRRNGRQRARRWIWFTSCLALFAVIVVFTVLIAKGPASSPAAKGAPGASASAGGAAGGPGALPGPSDSGSASASASASATPTASSSVSAGASAGARPTTSHGATPGAPVVAGGTYVQAGTQGYRGSMSALTVYSAANKKVPNSDCEWIQANLYLRCGSDSLNLSHVEIEGGLYWTGCGSLTISDSVVYMAPSNSWFDIYAQCPNGEAGSSLTVTGTTMSTGAGTPAYNGGSDIGGLWTDSDRPMFVSHSLVEGFPQGLDPDGGSVIKDNEIYPALAQCNSGAICHGDGLFSQGGSNMLYEGNRIVMPPSNVTASVFFQSDGSNTGNQVIGNYLDGGAYTVYNQSATAVDIEDNVFAGYIYGNACLTGSASWGVWSGNVDTKGAMVTPS